jgi:hypothetical protein
MNRFSSRRQKLDQSFPAQRLKGAKAYDRIAGYFCGSILETAGEALESVQGPIRVVCNSGLQPHDVATARDHQGDPVVKADFQGARHQRQAARSQPLAG